MQDRLQRETNDKKNDLESYIYSLRNKLSDVLADYAPESMKSSLMQTLNDMEVRAPGLCCTALLQLAPPANLADAMVTRRLLNVTAVLLGCWVMTVQCVPMPAAVV